MRLLLAGLLLVISSVSFAQFGDSSSSDNPFANVRGPAFLPVEEAFVLDTLAEPEGLRLYWQIADSYYLYQHQFKFTLQDDKGDVPVTVELPPALERHDDFFGETRVYYGNADILLGFERPLSGTASLSVSSQGCADAGLCYPPRQQHFAIDPVSGQISALDAPLARNEAVGSASTTPGAVRILTMIALALLGGSLLNLMPCVFPVLSLKALSFAQAEPHTGHRQSWLYAAGVIISFVLVAAALIALQQAGRAIGWGFQLQSPGFVIALAYLFLVMGLALSGLVELGSSLMNSGNKLASRQGDSGSFFTGVLAVVVASPCTAPLMGTALGFAVTQSAPIALLIFAALGAGMAAPMVLLSYSGAVRRLLPRPGPWMETFKQLLAFPLYASAIWLLWVAGRQTGVDTMAAALLGALFVALALWFWRPAIWRRIAALACFVAAVMLALWRPGVIATDADKTLEFGQPWSAATQAELRANGQAVFVDVTADWCITCIANERSVLLTDDIKQAFNTHNVVYLVADWTRYNPEIANFLRQHDRNGIPFYVVYPADPAARPIVLPQILSKETVLEALEAVTTKKSALARAL